MGAKCVSESADILDDLNIKPQDSQLPKEKSFDATPMERKLLEIINFEPIGVNELIIKMEEDAGKVTASLTFLEMKGKIRNLGGQQYVLARKL
jgi:DNA processing protein